MALLAYRLGLVGREALAESVRDWAPDRGRSLVQVLVDRGALGGTSLDRLMAAAAPLRGRSPGVDATMSFGADAPGTAPGPLAVGETTSAGRRFRVLRLHEKGGLGAVFLARDEELHRDVALKEIQARFADDPGHRARFQFEAEVTGGLEHPGIVPVYGLGADEHGRPYYAMRMIRGDSLKEAIERFHADERPVREPGRRGLALRNLLRRFIDVCNAVDYAHSRGVLHRDLKPGNIMVGRYGETLVVDWGMARATGRPESLAEGEEPALLPSAGEGTAETLPGTVLGTPAYMSPEQAAGDLGRLGARSDVYGLGATLYALLTGRPPFEGATPSTCCAVRRGRLPAAATARPGPRAGAGSGLPQGDGPPPRGPIRLAPVAGRGHRAVGRRRAGLGLPRAVVRGPCPVADPAPHGGHGRGGGVLVGLVGLAAVLVVQTRAKANDLAAANAELTRSRATVQARYDLSVDAIKTFYTGVSEDFLLKEDRFKDLRDRLLRSASDFYAKLAALLGEETDLGSRRALAGSKFELAELTASVGRKEDALAAHRGSWRRREALAAAPGADPTTAVDMSRSLTAVGSALEDLGRNDEALAAYQKARKAVSDAAGEPAGGEEARSAFSDAVLREGGVLRAIGRTADALLALERARDVRAALAAADAANDDRQSALAVSHDAIAKVLRAIGRPADSLASHEAARAIRQRLVEAHPDVTRYRNNLGSTLGNLGLLLCDAGRTAEGLASHEAARRPRRAGQGQPRRLPVPERPGDRSPQHRARPGRAGEARRGAGVVRGGADDLRVSGGGQPQGHPLSVVHGELSPFHRPAARRCREARRGADGPRGGARDPEGTGGGPPRRHPAPRRPGRRSGSISPRSWPSWGGRPRRWRRTRRRGRSASGWRRPIPASPSSGASSRAATYIGRLLNDMGRPTKALASS